MQSARQFGKPILEYEAIIGARGQGTKASGRLLSARGTLRDEARRNCHRKQGGGQAFCTRLKAPSFGVETIRLGGYDTEVLSGRALYRDAKLCGWRRHVRGAADGEGAIVVPVKRTIIATCGAFWRRSVGAAQAGRRRRIARW